MLNVYKFYDNPKDLPLYDKLNGTIDLLMESTWWNPSMVGQLEPLMSIIIKSPEFAFTYVAFVMEYSRWPEGEPAIMKEARFAYAYARDVIKGRWHKAESIIMKNPMYAWLYARYVIKGRWEEAEPVIMTRAESAYQYAKNILKSRWPEAEPYIQKKLNDWATYKEYFGIKD